VTSYTLTPESREKANSDDSGTVDEEISNRNDIQRSKEDRVRKQQLSPVPTNNSNF
jgi:hypothetical protein